MHIPTSWGSRAISSAIETRLSSYTLVRPTESSGPLGGGDDTTDVTVDMWVFDPNEVNTDTDFGERLNGSLGGLTRPSEDVQVGDRLTYQTHEYEVAELMTYDGASSDTYLMVNLVRYNDS